VIQTLKKLTMTKLIATHDLDMALEVCDRVVILNKGKIFADGPVKEILYDEKLLLEANLELPLGLQKIN
jgi:cobalt/nickel transport system ATP-binding protein